jgi:hypothetical protein
LVERTRWSGGGHPTLDKAIFRACTVRCLRCSLIPPERSRCAPLDADALTEDMSLVALRYDSGPKWSVWRVVAEAKGAG